MGGGTSMLVVRTDEGRPSDPGQTTTLSLVPLGLGRAMMQIVFETTARNARQNVSDRMNDLMQSLFEFIDEHVGREEEAAARAAAAKRVADRATVANFPTRTCSAAYEAGTLKDLPVPVLKRWMDDYALDYTGCVEKAEMVAAIEQHCFPSAECYVCLDTYQPGDRIRRLPCKHEFHVGCVDKWLLDVHCTCPTCRQDVTGDGDGALVPGGLGGSDSSDDDLDDLDGIITDSDDTADFDELFDDSLFQTPRPERHAQLRPDAVQIATAAANDNDDSADDDAPPPI
eukprot:SAG22_NODE_97_length_20760_cov_43.302850_13_plen_285_part_00